MTLAGKPGGYVVEHTMNEIDSEYEPSIYDQNSAPCFRAVPLYQGGGSG